MGAACRTVDAKRSDLTSTIDEDLCHSTYL